MSDIQSVIGASSLSNTPSIASAATALAANKARGAWMIQNLGTNALFVLLGTGASTSVFHLVLKAAAGNDDGSGGVFSQEDGVVWQGIVTIAGTSPRYCVTELTS